MFLTQTHILFLWKVASFLLFLLTHACIHNLKEEIVARKLKKKIQCKEDDIASATYELKGTSLTFAGQENLLTAHNLQKWKKYIPYISLAWNS